jgi:hypothetical protein
MTVRPIIFVITPLRPMAGDPGWPADVSVDEGGRSGVFADRAFKTNQTFAKEVSRQIVLHGGVPVAPHLLFTQFLDDSIEEERTLGMSCGNRLLAIADEAWSVLPDWRGDASGGMRIEIGDAIGFGAPVHHARIPGPTLAVLLDRLAAGGVPLRQRLFT